jgi:short-subunit dehydrogenase
MAQQQEAPPGLALVTGASSGIGLALARELAAHGHDLVVAAEDDAVHEVAHQLRLDPGVQVSAVQVDLATVDGVTELHRRVRAEGRPVRVAALNAGMAVGGPFVATDLAADLRLVDLNVRSVVHLTKLLVRDMLDGEGGRLLITSSIVAGLPGPWYATYAASKAFVQSFGDALRHELRGTDVTVTALLPGPTATAIFERAGMGRTWVGRGPKDDPERVARDAVAGLSRGARRVVAGSPLNRVMTASPRLLPARVVTAAHGVLTRPRT